jgi:hypothetical protein
MAYSVHDIPLTSQKTFGFIQRFNDNYSNSKKVNNYQSIIINGSEIKLSELPEAKFIESVK